MSKKILIPLLIVIFIISLFAWELVLTPSSNAPSSTTAPASTDGPAVDSAYSL